MQEKSEVFAKFKIWKMKVKNQTGRKIKYVRSNNGTQYNDSYFQKFCEYGLQRYFTVCKTPQHNGISKRMNRSIVERVKCLRLIVGLPKSFWVEVVNMTCYLINKSP